MEDREILVSPSPGIHRPGIPKNSTIPDEFKNLSRGQVDLLMEMARKELMKGLKNSEGICQDQKRDSSLRIGGDGDESVATISSQHLSGNPSIRPTIAPQLNEILTRPHFRHRVRELKSIDPYDVRRFLMDSEKGGDYQGIGVHITGQVFKKICETFQIRIEDQNDNRILAALKSLAAVDVQVDQLGAYNIMRDFVYNHDDFHTRDFERLLQKVILFQNEMEIEDSRSKQKRMEKDAMRILAEILPTSWGYDAIMFRAKGMTLKDLMMDMKELYRRIAGRDGESKSEISTGDDSKRDSESSLIREFRRLREVLDEKSIHHVATARVIPLAEVEHYGINLLCAKLEICTRCYSHDVEGHRCCAIRRDEERACFNCKQLGHYYKDCKEPLRDHFKEYYR